jgi:hypothetical protein
MRYDSTPYGIGHGEGSPLLHESEDAAAYIICLPGTNTSPVL